MSKEKQNLSLVDPESLGLGVSLGHLDAIRSGEKYRTPQIKAMESYADMAFHMGSDVDALNDLIADFIQNWLEDNISDELYNNMYETALKYTSKDSFETKTEELFNELSPSISFFSNRNCLANSFSKKIFSLIFSDSSLVVSLYRNRTKSSFVKFFFMHEFIFS